MEQKSIQFYMNDNELNLEQIVREYSSYIFMIVKNKTKNLLSNEDIEEIISDVLFVVWKNKDNLDFNLPLKPYIAGVTNNITKNRLRDLRPTSNCLELDTDIKYDEEIEEIIENKEEFEIISDELNKMKKEDNKIFVMFYYKGKKSKDIAIELKISESKVNTKLHRIRNRLKKELEKRGYHYGE